MTVTIQCQYQRIFDRYPITTSSPVTFNSVGQLTMGTGSILGKWKEPEILILTTNRWESSKYEYWTEIKHAQLIEGVVNEPTDYSSNDLNRLGA